MYDSGPSHATERWAVAPLPGFSLDWPGEYHDLGFSVCLLAADEETTSRMAEFLRTDPQSYEVEQSEWILATRYLIPGFVRVVDFDNPGAPSRPERHGAHGLHAEIVRSFVTAWNLLKPCGMLHAPIFGAKVEPASHHIVEVEGLDDYAWFSMQSQHVCETEDLTLGDVGLFQEMWPAICKLRKFPDDIEGYDESTLQRFFGSEQVEQRSAETRLGRALGLFEGSIWLGRFHAFLSLWLALESLFVTSDKRVKMELCCGIGRFLGSREECLPHCLLAKGLYEDVRCKVVHGESDRIDATDMSETYDLCCKCLQKILVEPGLFATFTSRKGEDTQFLEKLRCD